MKKDSRTKWQVFNSVRYRDCPGGYYFPNNDCNYRKEYNDVPSYLHFKDERRNICGTTGTPVACIGRKYIAHKHDQAHV